MRPRARAPCAGATGLVIGGGDAGLHTRRRAPHLSFSSASSFSHFSNWPVTSTGARRTSFTFRKNSYGQSARMSSIATAVPRESQLQTRPSAPGSTRKAQCAGPARAWGRGVGAPHASAAATGRAESCFPTHVTAPACVPLWIRENRKQAGGSSSVTSGALGRTGTYVHELLKLQRGLHGVAGVVQRVLPRVHEEGQAQLPRCGHKSTSPLRSRGPRGPWAAPARPGRAVLARGAATLT